jgi:hypothetical protein
MKQAAEVRSSDEADYLLDLVQGGPKDEQRFHADRNQHVRINRVGSLRPIQDQFVTDRGRRSRKAGFTLGVTICKRSTHVAKGVDSLDFACLKKVLENPPCQLFFSGE